MEGTTPVADTTTTATGPASDGVPDRHSPDGAPPWPHARGVEVRHDDGEPCQHGTRRGSCLEGQTWYGTCPCLDAPVVLHAYAALTAFNFAHPTRQESADAEARAAWLDEPDPVDADVWARLRAGLRTLLREADEAAEDADFHELEALNDDERRAHNAVVADALVSGYMIALGHLRDLPFARDEIVMWLMSDGSAPGSFLENIVAAARGGDMLDRLDG